MAETAETVEVTPTPTFLSEEEEIGEEVIIIEDFPVPLSDGEVTPIPASTPEVTSTPEPTPIPTPIPTITPPRKEDINAVLRWPGYKESWDIGDITTFYVDIYGFGDYPYTITWQYSDDGGKTFTDIDWHEDYYTITITAECEGRCYRVSISWDDGL